MTTIQLLARKGGAGKTTLALHLAVAAAAAGRAVAIIDADEQASALAWASRRDPDAIPILVVAGGRDLGQTVGRIDADLVIVDSPPSAQTRGAWQPDRIIVPVQPSALDLGALGATLDLLGGRDLDAMAVLMRCPPRSVETDEARAYIRDLGLHVAQTTIGERRDFARALAAGAAATEYAPRSRAAQEITELLQEVLA
ncbi:MAG: ParA family protein [Candidatus Eremiobacteraeota bacterium]|nr:ParA family protein [Candidatus Eremiobacteraeota bacterium]